MSPAEDARLLLASVRRHLSALGIGLDPAYPEEDWGFTAQQVVEKLLKAWIVLSDRRPPRGRELTVLAALAGQPLEPAWRRCSSSPWRPATRRARFRCRRRART